MTEVVQLTHVSFNNWMQECSYGTSSVSPQENMRRTRIFLPLNLASLFFTYNLYAGANNGVSNISVQMLFTLE